MGITKAEYQRKKNDKTINVLKQLAGGIARGELDVEFSTISQGLELGAWNFRLKVNETEKYGNRNKLSEL